MFRKMNPLVAIVKVRLEFYSLLYLCIFSAMKFKHFCFVLYLFLNESLVTDRCLEDSIYSVDDSIGGEDICDDNFGSSSWRGDPHSVVVSET